MRFSRLWTSAEQWHVHLLLNEPPKILLAHFLKAVQQVTSRKLRAARVKFWQERYYDSNVRGEAARSEVIRYIHRNPVARGLVKSPEDWPWSSFRHYATGVKGPVEIESHWTAFWRRNHLPEGIRIEHGERSRFPPEAPKKGPQSETRSRNEYEDESPARSSQKAR